MRSFWLCVALGLALMGCQPGKEPVDLIVHNAIVYTVDKSFAKAEAFAVKDGKFVEVGKSDDILNKYESEKIFNARRLSILPGFNDAHAHFYGLGEDLDLIDLRTANSMDDVITQIRQRLEEQPELDWIMGRGWDQNQWGESDLPTNEAINAAFPDKKIALIRIDAHALLASQAALDAAGIDPNTEIPGGLIVKKNGQLTGMLLEAAKEHLLRAIPQPEETLLRQRLLAAQKVCFEHGITSISDAGISKDMALLMQKMYQEGQLKLRINAMLSPTEENKAYFLEKGPIQDDRFTVRSFKFYADGALGSRGAYLLEPYSDAPETRGLFLLDSAAFLKDLRLLKEKGFQVATHCIGDGTNRKVLQLYAQVLEVDNDNRWRIEHAQVVHPDDLLMFQRYRIIPSVQPTHAISDMEWATKRLGEQRIKHAYAFQQLYEQNNFIVFGTDFPVEAPNPIHTFHAATARQNARHQPAEGFQPENAVNTRTAIRAMTQWPAHAAFEEAQKGTIEAGKVADFVILDTDILDTDKRLLRNTLVLITFLNGEQVFSLEGGI
ncbi:MAG: amidohydrolase [Bernardetiaceae bacterium]